MPYAAEGRISSDYFEGSVFITDAEYAAAMEGMLNGLIVTIGAGQKVVMVDPSVEPEKPPPTQAELDAQAHEAWKIERALAVQAIRVVVDGMEFEGDETSQGRMSRAIIGLQSRGDGANIRWVLADNTAVEVNAVQLTEALTLSGLRQAELWVKA